MNFFEKNIEEIILISFIVLLAILVLCIGQEQKECEQKGGVMVDGKCLDIKELK